MEMADPPISPPTLSSHQHSPRTSKEEVCAPAIDDIELS